MQTNKSLWQVRSEKGVDKEQLAKLTRAGIPTNTLETATGGSSVVADEVEATTTKKGSKKSKDESGVTE